MSKCHPTLQSSPAHITACSRFIPRSGSPWAQPRTGNIQLGSSQRRLEVQQDTGHVLDNTLRKGKDGEVTSPGRELRLKYKWLLFHTSTSDDYSPDLLLKSWKEEWEKAQFSLVNSGLFHLNCRCITWQCSLIIYSSTARVQVVWDSVQVVRPKTSNSTHNTRDFC